MKLNMDESLPIGVRRAFAAAERDKAPEPLRGLLAIDGVTGVFHTADFIALDRHPKGDWQRILREARGILGESSEFDRQAPAGVGPGAEGAGDAFGEVTVLVQMFRAIPMQVRVKSGGEERRAALPERFANAAMEAGAASPNLITERKLVEHGVRYGELDDVLAEIVRELEAAYDESRLTELVKEAMAMTPAEAADPEAAAEAKKPAGHDGTEARAHLAEALQSDDWRVRFAALERFSPDEEAIPLLARALDDPQMSIRRLATVYLGDIKTPEVLPFLFRALRDKSVAVRRTAGDTLSDIGSPEAIGPMLQALQDPNKLVRWRAARFLFEQGDESALEGLRAASEDPEFEVRMQIRLAIERIEGGEEAQGSVWQQMTNRDR